MNVTLKDIARKANVSISTVSRIINDDKTKPASPETAEPVWRIVRELGYIPKPKERFIVDEDRLDLLLGNNKWETPFVKKIKEVKK